MTSTDLNPSIAAPDSALATATGGKAIQRQTQRALDRVAGSAQVALLTERARAELTNEALLNAGSLSALEAHLIRVAPLGEERYRHIVDAHALAAASEISRFR